VLPAKIEPAAEGRIVSEYAARVSAVHVTNGAVVQAGDPIVTLENPEIGMQVMAAENRVAIANSKLRDARSRERTERESGAEQIRVAALRARDSAKERMDAFTLDPLQKAYDRAAKRTAELTGLANRGLATNAELENARTVMEAAGRELSAAREHSSRLRQELADSEDRVHLSRTATLPSQVDVTSARADLEDAQNTLAIAKERAARLRVIAPVSGTVIGLALRPGDTVLSGATFARVADLANLSLSAPVTASVARDVRPGAPVTVKLPLEPQRKISAVVDGISLGPDPAQRAYFVRVVIPNPEHTAVLVGLEAEIEFSHSRPQ
jgi:multidrug resistance efflux pump